MPESRRIRALVLELIELYVTNSLFSEIIDSCTEYRITQKDLKFCYNANRRSFDYNGFLHLAEKRAEIRRSH